ncbi:DNA gyrase subunit A [Brachybacterium muris]|uniref:DNA gyrase/topoisomerase IV subunit A n=1 Tax=Brachybacterium muris TaxID=219301 RepID=UPI00195E5105|nr:DNA topoisomerase IV subunit A [Brachybacterium muris]MBM7500479.1 DNA gyrase subunit A [Brachybacterium muris]MCT1431717.1 DNA topoisomerase IV subunit A [Brachybacterium muris]MCT2262350.1 DNA topoisomerase IV subunit A [Brachybacterium muris]
MARSRSTKPEAGSEPIEETILDIDVTSEMEASFLEYAYSVIYSRALPDARDGLKPVQRRILYMMAEMGLRPDRGHVKSQRVVGEVMGKLHPHGDTAIYDALVRMAQPFSMRLPLIDGHGNFGSLDNGPAAPRYTEARLAKAALLMTDSLDEDVVDTVPNYDNQLTQPEVLPAQYPNLLVNGAAGIAVGMATNMAPHNLVETIAAARHLIDHPDAELEELMRFVPGPDLPSGGRIIGLEGVRDAYRTGRGSFKMRATTRIENVTSRRKGIVVTELPYQVGPEKVAEKLRDAVQAKKVQGITDYQDLTDRHHGLRLVLTVKSGYDPEAVLQQLYRHTPLEESFGINNVALVEGQPRTLGLKQLLEVFVDHRITVVRRRTEYRLRKRLDRLHLVEGLLLAIVDIDEVIQIVRSSDDAESARTRLMGVFDLTHVQAEYILELRLRRLTKFSQIELEGERDELRAEIERLQEILGSDEVLRRLVSDELAAVAAEHGTPRRTVLLEAAEQPVAAAGGSLEVADEPCGVLLTGTGLIARVAGEGPLLREGPRGSHDVVVSDVATTTRSEVGVVTDLGRVLRLNVVDLPSLAPTAGAPSLAGGTRLSDLIDLGKDEKPLALIRLAEADVARGGAIALGTRQGVVKRVQLDFPRTDGFEIIALKDGDRVVGAVDLEEDADLDLVFVTSDAQLLHFPSSGVRPQGRGAGGVAGIKLTAGAHVVSFGVIDVTRQADVVTVAGSSGTLPVLQTGSLKVSAFTEYPAKGRATGGVRCHRFLRGEDVLIGAWVVPHPARASSEAGQPIELPEPTGRRDGSGTPVAVPIAAVG